MPELLIQTVPRRQADDKQPRRPKVETDPNAKKQTSKTFTLEKELNEYATWISWGAGILNKQDGIILKDGIPPVIHEGCMLAESDPKLLKFLRFIASPGKYGPLVLAVSGCVIPVAINHNMLPFLVPTAEKEAA